MNILIAVSGSIAAYKAPDICRGLVNQGHKVKVVLSKGALEFVNPQVFKYLGVEETFLPDDDFKHKNVLHINLSKWLDSFILVPASANTLSKISHGQCDDLLTSIFLSLEPQKVKVLYPAMNTYMYQNFITQNNLSLLQKIPNCYLIEPDSGVLACGDEGPGKLTDVRSIVEMIPIYSNKKVNKTVVITAGATLSNLDPVRYVTNPAKGGSSYLIAKEYLSQGYKVFMIKGQDVIPDFKFLDKHPNYQSQTVSTTQDLLDTVKNLNFDFDIYISPMAVSDIEFDYVDGKIKKSTLKGSFNFKFAPDVLKYVVENKKPHQKIVGFAAETSLDKKVIEEKINRKPVDLLVANLVNSGFNQKAKQGFGTREGHYKLVTKDSVEEFKNLSKGDLAKKIFAKIN
jgi:phosphopantothenoylcysteine decarboxylase/phosphopantothenate--cysteine ligase